MEKTIYHGSQNVIEKPIWGYGKVYNDYGLGFYCTENIDLAKEWSVSSQRDGYVNQYDIETDKLNVLDLNGPEYCLLHWITILLQNRKFNTSQPVQEASKEYLFKNFSIPLEGVDIITGYRADDRYFAYANDFISNTITYEQLSEAMHLWRLGEQFVLKSKKAFDEIKFVESELVKNKYWFAKKEIREIKAKMDYENLKMDKVQIKGLYMIDILREEMKANDQRLRLR